jgi:hypothetical protein
MMVTWRRGKGRTRLMPEPERQSLPQDGMAEPYCPLPTAYCLPPTAYCLLPTAYFFPRRVPWRPASIIIGAYHSYSLHALRQGLGVALARDVSRRRRELPFGSSIGTPRQNLNSAFPRTTGSRHGARKSELPQHWIGLPCTGVH